MVKKTSAAPRAAPRTAKADVVTRVPAETVSRRAYRSFKRAAASTDMTSKTGSSPKPSSAIHTHAP